MSKYTVVKSFVDSKDNYRAYNVGDDYPHADYKPSKGRIEALLTGNNVNGKIYIEEIPSEATPHKKDDKKKLNAEE